MPAAMGEETCRAAMGPETVGPRWDQRQSGRDGTRDKEGRSWVRPTAFLRGFRASAAAFGLRLIAVGRDREVPAERGLRLGVEENRELFLEHLRLAQIGRLETTAVDAEGVAEVRGEPIDDHR